MDEVDEQGFAGDTRRASAELGHQLLEHVVAFWLDHLRRIHALKP